MEEDKPLFLITVGDAQYWAEEKLGRRLTYEELQKVQKDLEWGLCEGIDVLYNAIFDEMKTDERT